MGSCNRDLLDHSTRELLRRCCSLSVAAHRSSNKLFLLDKVSLACSSPLLPPAYAIFSFPGSWSAEDWLSEKASDDPFGICKVDGDLFPSLRTVYRRVPAVAHAGFLGCFRRILQDSAFRTEVDKALCSKKQIVFTGHSSSGTVSALAAIWLLESLNSRQLHHTQCHPLCVTFGSPLVGNDVFANSLLREGWTRYFLNVVMYSDIVPRILLAPFRAIEKDLQEILHLLSSKWPSPVGNSQLAAFFIAVLRHSQDITNKRACVLTRCTNPLLSTFASFTQLSPYRPFGAYVFCAMDKLLVVNNSEAVLQLLFHFLQVGCEQHVEEAAYRSFNEHLLYESEMQTMLDMPDVVHLESLQSVPLSLHHVGEEARPVGILLRDIGLGAEARVCLRAIGELENQRELNQKTVDEIRPKIKKAIYFLKDYQEKCKNRGLGYYDTFKLQKNNEDFDANVKRIELAGLWDQIVEMLKRCDLPCGFETSRKWIKLGTDYRRVVEPLDIANYYRHAKNEDTGPYLLRGRPSRYMQPESWLEHADRKDNGSCSDSCFWANVEELIIDTKNGKPYSELRDRIVALEERAEHFFQQKLLGEDVFLEGSTFVRWWRTLPPEHRATSNNRRHIKDA